MVFVLIYFPCVATIGMMLKELRPKWVLFAPIYTLTLAFLVSALVIVIGHLIGLS